MVLDKLVSNAAAAEQTVKILSQRLAGLQKAYGNLCTIIISSLIDFLFCSTGQDAVVILKFKTFHFLKAPSLEKGNLSYNKY